MKLKELEDIKECNELDLLYKIIEMANNSKKRTEEVLGGNKQAGVDVRKSLQDIKIISEIIRDMIQIRKNKKSKDKKNKIDQAIKKENDRLRKEDEKIKRLEKKRSNFV